MATPALLVDDADAGSGYAADADGDGALVIDELKSN